MAGSKTTYRVEVLPEEVLSVVGKYMLVEGYRFVPDLVRSHGCWLYDATNGREVLDMFAFYSTNPLGHNHPALTEDEEFLEHLKLAAIANPSNSDFYTVEFATFLKVFAQVAMGGHFVHAFFISGGALAVENALKVAMDWKVQKNFKKGLREEKGHQVIHFREGFHGRSGYTLSLTNTTPEKTRYFAQFRWPRITNPKITFPLEQHLEEVERLERKAIEEIKEAFRRNPDDVCAIIIEPIQSEGGDNHFRGEFLKKLRELSDENDCLLIFDEVQTGVALTGRFWCYQHFDVVPDIIAFGKRMQVCGIIAGTRVDEVPDNCFRVKGRINSTWGGSLVDMVRATKILQVIEAERLWEQAGRVGSYLLKRLQELAEDYPEVVSNVRGRGLMCAVDLPSREVREAVVERALQEGMLILRCGERSIRFRPPLIVTEREVDIAIEILRRVLKRVAPAVSVSK